MADLITLCTDAELERALDVLTRDGTPRSVAIRRAVVEAAMRSERAVAMRQAVLRMPLGTPDGIDVGAALARDRPCEPPT
ncbi:hypothetical protein GCM10029976_064020 [Kribbella albertanoniae]|uniref:Ribbon-helix-helix protein, CopG family n=1 Tax=Kribbella albertanoniae TaxID=1266829 RepID=A0A4R4PDH4_9ACTN|nr:hypothetical protein [Kribbella albertanoniae]TDC19227.1 hypothetical protein E1261_34325 [Kribbella albertanoniae]